MKNSNVQTKLRKLDSDGTLEDIRVEQEAYVPNVWN